MASRSETYRRAATASTGSQIALPFANTDGNAFPFAVYISTINADHSSHTFAPPESTKKESDDDPG
ncbi:MAG TPA: hypothetical protein VGO96_20790 [Pyrinomonadaceae bacterium]|nr:hypothetical protein [Pyrinomonadaceae bacterium]